MSLNDAACAAADRAFERCLIRRVHRLDLAAFTHHESLAGVGCAILPLPERRDDVTRLFAALAARRSPVSLIFLAEKPDVRTIVEAIRCGAVEVLPWPGDATVPDAVVEAGLRRSQVLQQLESGRAAARASLGRLNHGERDVLEHMLAGRVNKSVASQLGIALRTVENRRKQIFTKLGTRSLADIVRIVQQADTHAAESWPPSWHLGRVRTTDSSDLAAG